jgi:hypothetical protein
MNSLSYLWQKGLTIGVLVLCINSTTFANQGLPLYFFQEYKSFTSSASDPNDGFEMKNEETTVGNSIKDVENSEKTLGIVRVISDPLPVIPGVDMQKISNKVEVLSHHSRIWSLPAFNTFNFTFKLLTTNEYQVQKSPGAFAFDAGFVTSDGTICISEPTTTEQKAVFPDLTGVAMYYLCQAYLFHFYQTSDLPLLFKVGFPLFEAGIIPSDAVIKTAVNAYGGNIPSFEVLNSRSTFITNNGIAVAVAFGEFMNVFKNWGYPFITNVSASGFDVASYWFQVDNLAGLLDDFNRYLYHRFLQEDENLRIKLYLETDHFKFYTRPADGTLNFPLFSNTCENAYNEYVNNFQVTHGEKLSFFTLPECFDAIVEGVACGNRITGGTAWSSGVHSTCAATVDQLIYFESMCRHELAHSFQAIFPAGSVTAWLNEGFPSFCSAGPISEEKLTQLRQSGIDCINAAINYFGHRPTYEETRIYPLPDYGYYNLGYFFIDYQYRRGGYPLVKAIQMNDLYTYQSLGYSTSQAFLDDFYFDFDVRVQQIPVVTLINPVKDNDELNSSVNVSWTPLKSDVKLNVSVSTDDGATWTEIVNRTTATSCTWNSGDISKRFYLKFTAPDNLNLSSTYGPFVHGNLNGLNIVSPVLNNYSITGDTLAIKWSATSIQQVKVEYSLNNGSSWNNISNSVSGSSREYKWLVPANLIGACLVKITDFNNGSVSSTSETFRIVKNDEIGGPYLLDKNTILLLHFDNDLDNRSYLAPNGAGNLLNLTDEASTVPNLGNCYKTTSALSVPHHANLNMTGDWTIEAWVKLNSYDPNNNMYLFWKPGNVDPYQSNYSLEVNPWWGNVFHGYYFSQLNNRIGITGASPLLNEWYHVAFIRDSKNKLIRLIVHDKNRNLISDTEISFSPDESYLNNKDLLIGSNLDGYVDEIRISNIVRTFVITGVDEVKESRSFSIFPNPSSGMVKIQTAVPVNGAKISVINTTGRTVLVKELTNDEIIDLSLLSKGLYLIRITGKDIIQTEKLILK